MIKQEDFVLNDVINEGDSEENIKMSIDTDSINHLMMVLSSNLYQNSIGSIVREYTSNAIDANAEAKSTNPVIVKLTSTEFSVEDFGTGLDDVDFRNIISKYGKSTKKEKDDQLGYYGLGCKSAFSYTNIFRYECIKNGIERKYALYKDADGFSIDLVSEQLTDKSNGVKVIIPLKSYDYSQFEREIKQQLAYFDGVYFDIQYVQNINNEHKVYEDGDLRHSTIYPKTEMHICLGKVNYPIDWNQLGISRIGLNIGIHFDLNSGIFPTPSREAIIWNSKTKDLVKNKILEISDLLIKRYNSKVETFKDFFDAYLHVNTSHKYIDLFDRRTDISCLSFYCTTAFSEPHIPSIKVMDPKFYKRFKDHMFQGYKIFAAKRYGNLTTTRIYTSISDNDVILEKKSIVIGDNDILTGYLRDYIKSLPYDYIIKKTHHIYSDEDYVSLFGKGYTKEQKEEFDLVRESFLKRCFVDKSDISISPEFLQYKKDNKKKVTSKSNYVSIARAEDEIIISQSSKSNGMNSYGFQKRALTMSQLEKDPYMHVLIEPDDIFDKNYYCFTYSKQKIVFIKPQSKKDLKILKSKKIHNLVMLKEIDKTRAFRKIATAYKIRELITKYNNIFNYSRSKFIDESFKKFSDLKNELHEYEVDNYVWISNDTISTSMIKIAEQYNLWDMQIYHKLKQFEDFIKEFDFISYLRNPSSSDNPDDYSRIIYGMLLMKRMKFNKLPEIDKLIKIDKNV